MWQFSEAVDGITEATKSWTALRFWNVSFYNTTDGNNIHPTPSRLGSLAERCDQGRAAAVGAGLEVAVLGSTEGDLVEPVSRSAWAASRASRPPRAEAERARRRRWQLRRGVPATAHDEHWRARDGAGALRSDKEPIGGTYNLSAVHEHLGAALAEDGAWRWWRWHRCNALEARCRGRAVAVHRRTGVALDHRGRSGARCRCAGGRRSARIDAVDL